MTNPARLLGQMKGLWIASRLTAPVAGDPAYGAGCEIGSTGRRIIVELFYNPSAVLRFGSDTFGSEAFGQYVGAAPTVAAWQDITQYAYGGLVTRGNLRPNINAPADAFTFDLYDPTADLVEWRPPGSLASPGLNTPCRVGISAYNGTYFQIYQGRTERMKDEHDAPIRSVEFSTFGNKADLITSLLNPKFPKQTAQARITSVLTTIGWQNGYDPGYPADNPDLSHGLEADADERYGDDALAYNIIQQAAVSCGYRVSINRAGQFRLLPILVGNESTGLIVADCYQPGETIDAIYNTALFVADASETLNVVQLVNRPFPNKSAEATDVSSVAKWGRRTQGYGFPVEIANDDTGETQDLADQILALTKDIVNRCERITFNTISDPNWWTAFGSLEIGKSIVVKRFNPEPIEFNCVVIGLDWSISENGYIEGTINVSSTDPSL